VAARGIENRIPQTVSLVKEATPLELQTRQVGRTGLTFHGLRAEVQRFGLVLPPRVSGDATAAETGTLQWRCRPALTTSVKPPSKSVDTSLTHHCNLETKLEISEY
jgi:hypothetical protein